MLKANTWQGIARKGRFDDYTQKTQQLTVLKLFKISWKYFALPLVIIFLLVGISQIAAIVYFSKTSPKLVKADLIAVFPGGEGRVPAGYRMIEQGLSNNLLVVNLNSRQLRKKAAKYSVPATIGFLNSRKSRSTFEDIHITKELARDHRFKSLILVTSAYHMPRALLLLKTSHMLAGIDVDIQAAPVKATSYTLATHLKLYYNEQVKLWGTLLEMLLYQITGILPADMNFFKDLVKFLNTYLVFSINS